MHKLIPCGYFLLPSHIHPPDYHLVLDADITGANFVEDASGRLLHLDRLSELKRRGVAARLLSNPGQKVRGSLNPKHNHKYDKYFFCYLRGGQAALFGEIHVMVVFQLIRYVCAFFLAGWGSAALRSLVFMF